LTWAVGRQLYDRRSAALAVIVQASSLLYLAMARIATLDMGLSFGLQIAMCALALLAQQPATRGRWRLPVMLGVGVAFAVLSKGLVGILIPGAVACVYVLWRRDWTLPLRAQPWWTVVALALLAAPWFVLVSRRNPEFAHFFFIVQHFQRYLSRDGFDRYQPVWFFVWVLALGLLPWTSLLPGALRQAWRGAHAGERGTAMLLAWALLVFAFFSLSQSKLVPYILPVVPALALLIGRRLASMSAAGFARHLSAIAIAAVTLALLICALWRLPAAASLVAQASTPSILGFAAAFLLLGLAVIAGVALARRSHLLAGATAAALGSWMLAQCALLSADQLPRMQAVIALEQHTRPWVGDATHVYCVNDYLQPLPFYWRRPCTLVGYRGELDFGLRQEPGLWIADLRQFADEWQRQSDALAVLRPEDYRQLRALGLPMHVIYTAQSSVAVIRR
ncbi:MAG TPA: phospholipid carrier-dependent glycosyltransferase, partial [Steroidobacteraceae bacterium]